MILQNKITVQNYKSFDSLGGSFDKIMPINVIIGKNNSGKSSLIELVRYLTETHESFLRTGRDQMEAKVIIEHSLTAADIAKAFPAGTSGGDIQMNHAEYGKQFVGHRYIYQLGHARNNNFISVDRNFLSGAKAYFINLAKKMPSPLFQKSFCNIAAERDIAPESSTAQNLMPDGTGATYLIQYILNSRDQNSALIEVDLLRELNTILNPDIIFTRILVQSDSSGNWEIFFCNKHEKRIPLSKMGSGVKTVLLVLLNLIVRPIIENKDKASYVFAFEELENNLHPSMQRRMYEYIKNYSATNKTYFFLTTHSNIVIDTLGNYENAQLIHVIHDGDKSVSTTVISYIETKHILRDLDIKASDLLQSNGIIWVEGPSDRHYLNKWLELCAPELREGVHYSIMFYGGRLLSNLTFDFERFNREVIPLLKINRNAFVIMDRDGKSNDSVLNDTKQRIVSELGADSCWVTKGREIENYLSNGCVSRWLQSKNTPFHDFNNEPDTKLEQNIKASTTIDVKYHLGKASYSAEISENILEEDLEVLDLQSMLAQLIRAIKDWNSLL